MIRRFSQWSIFLLATALLVGVVFFIQKQIQAKANRPAPVKPAAENHLDVSVVKVRVISHQAKVTAYGAAEAHYSLTLTAQVAGQVYALGPNFESGKRLKKGDLLASLESSDYKAGVATAQKNLKDAELALLEEERTAKQAKAEWQASGLRGKPDSELVLREPQLAAARAAVTDAQAALASARKDLARVRITAPFDTLVIERSVAPGSYLQAGTTVATLYSTDRVEIPVSLSADEWNLLSDNLDLSDNTGGLEIADVQNGHVWSGRILRMEQHLDSTTRLRSLILTVENPLDQTPPLMPGTFVEARIKGRNMDHLWSLPSSSLSQKGEIWYVTDQNTLDFFTAKKQFSEADRIFIVPPESLADGEQNVLVHPLSSYTQGMLVNPVVEPDYE